MILSLITISFSPFWIPVILSILWGGFMFFRASQESGWLAGFTQVIGFIVGLPVIWMVFFAVMYFLK